MSAQPTDKINLLKTTEGNSHSDIVKPVNKRWLILIIYCLCTLTNSILWITFSPIALDVEEIYNITPLAVNFLSLIYFVMYVPGMFIASWVLDRKGLRAGITAGAVIFTVGAVVRSFGFNEKTFFITCIGQTICSIAQPFIQNAPAKVASHWFPDNQRAMATTIGSVAGPVGGAIGLVVPAVIFSIEKNITVLLVIDASFAFFCLILTLIFFRSHPPHPPSMTALNQRKNSDTSNSMNFLQAIKTLFTQKNFIIVFLCYGLNLGAFQALATLLTQFTTPFDYTPIQGSIMGACVVLFGVFGAGIFGQLMDRFRAYRIALFVCFAVATICDIIWTGLLRPDVFVWLLLCSCVFGTFLIPTLPLGIGLATEITFPMPEATPVGFLVMGGMIWSTVLILLMTLFMHYDLVHVASIVVAFQSGISFVLLFFFNGKLKRTEAERETEVVI